MCKMNRILFKNIARVKYCVNPYVESVRTLKTLSGNESLITRTHEEQTTINLKALIKLEDRIGTA
jgi:hypothetical protein